MPNGRDYRILAFLAALVGASVPAFAQNRPWVVFEDVFGGGLTCDIVHTDNLELVVTPDPVTGLDTFVIVTGFDDRIFETEILANNDVLFLDQPAGRIIFDNDADGFLAAWWVGFDDAVFSFDRITGELFTTNALPSAFVVSTCDGCDLWDIRSDCEFLIDDPILDPLLPPITINICGSSMAMAMSLTFIGLMGTGLARRRFVSRNSAATRVFKEREHEA